MNLITVLNKRNLALEMSVSTGNGESSLEKKMVLLLTLWSIPGVFKYYL